MIVKNIFEVSVRFKIRNKYHIHEGSTRTWPDSIRIKKIKPLPDPFYFRIMSGRIELTRRVGSIIDTPSLYFAYRKQPKHFDH
jgi:hypothetical protein